MKLLMIKSIVMEGVARFLEQYPKKVYSSKSKYSGTRRLGEMRDKVAALNLDKLCKELNA